jgi:hypothetical protein
MLQSAVLDTIHVRHAVTLFFETFLCTCQRYKTQNMVQGTHPQQGVQLILSNNYAIGGTDGVREITLVYKQR